MTFLLEKFTQEIGFPTCKKEKKTKEVCHNPNCKSIIFVCADENCECQADHIFCLKVGLNSLLKVISHKREKRNNDVSSYIEKLTDQMIDKISTMKDDLLSRLQYLGLSNNQRKFITQMQKRQYQNITSQDIHNICSNFHIKQSVSADNSIQFIQRFWNRDKKIFDNLLDKISNIVIKSLKSYPKSVNFDSKIIDNEQSQNLIEMFEEKINTVNLLYRGSEHDFSIPQFRKLCDKKKNTICLVKTVFGNVIGAYTPIPWNSSSNSQHISDGQLKTFIFSLTLNKKFVQTIGSNTTHHYSTWGPRFGNDGACDFAIGENADNAASKCYANICNLFIPQNPEDQKNMDFFKQNFVGGGIQGTNRFKITQWQMFEIQFL